MENNQLLRIGSWLKVKSSETGLLHTGRIVYIHPSKKWFVMRFKHQKGSYNEGYHTRDLQQMKLVKF